MATASSVERASDSLLDLFLVVLATWTVVFHVALLLDWQRDPTVGIWVVVLLAALVAGRILFGRARPPLRFDPVALRPLTRPLLLCAVGLAAAVAASAQVVRRPGWWLLWGAVILVCGGAALIIARAGRADPARATDDVGHPGRGGLVVAVALAFALLSLVTQRPDADDTYLVNRSVYVEQHSGAFPTRDTIFSDEVFRDIRPQAPESSIEPFLGVVARYTPMSAPTATYLVFGPLVAGLGILALWRMLRTLGAPDAALATAAAAVFLFLDGSEHASFGNFSFARSWQGKAVMVFVVVPLLWHHALRWSRDGDRRSLALLVAGNVAAIGLSSSAAFVATGVTLVGLAAGLGGWRLLVGLAAVAYPVGATLAVAVFGGTPPPLAAGGTELALGAAGAVTGQVAGLPGTLTPEAQWYFVFGTGPTMLIGAGAAFLAWTAVRDRAARLALAVAPLGVFLVFLSPGMLNVLDDVVGAGSVLWRAIWIIPVPAAVGLLVAALLRSSLLRVRALGWVVVAAAVVALLVVEMPVVSPDNRDLRFGGIAWNVDPDAKEAADRILELAEPPAVALAPVEVSGVLAISSVDVRSVLPRGSYLTGRHAVPEFQAPQREVVTRAVTTGIADEQAIPFADALIRLEVDIACVRPTLDDSPTTETLRSQGFVPVDRDEHCLYWRR